MEVKSLHFLGLSANSRCRYEDKLNNAGLFVNPYAIKDWIKESNVISSIAYSDLMLYMTPTPSTHTREETKVVLL